MVFCGGLLIYGTENDQFYLTDVIIRWGVSYGLYYAFASLWFVLIGNDLENFRLSFHTVRGLITSASYVGIYFYMCRMEV